MGLTVNGEEQGAYSDLKLPNGKLMMVKNHKQCFCQTNRQLIISGRIFK